VTHSTKSHVTNCDHNTSTWRKSYFLYLDNTTGM